MSQYLAGQGLQTSVAYFANSGFEMGRALQGKFFNLVFKVNQHQLLICDLQSRQEPKGIQSAVSEFVALIQQIEERVPEIHEVRGLLRTSGTDRERQLRSKLAEVLEKQGARRTEINGDHWLIYSCRRQFIH
jgi:hypothetical protein